MKMVILIMVLAMAIISCTDANVKDDLPTPAFGGSGSSSSSSPSLGKAEFWTITTDGEDDGARVKGTSKVENEKDENGNYIVIMQEDGGQAAKIHNYTLGGSLTSNNGDTYAAHVEMNLAMEGNDEHESLLECELGIAYSYKGSRHKFVALLGIVADYNYHYTIIPASETWEAAEIPFGSLKQEEWGNPALFRKALIETLRWEIRGGVPGGIQAVSEPAGSLAVKDIQCIQSSSSSGGGSSSSSSSGASSSSSSIESQAPGAFDGDYFTDPRDGNRYGYEIAPNGRVWMSENLNYSGGGTLGYCYKKGAESETLGTAGESGEGCDSPYGRTYTYEVAVGGIETSGTRGLCPVGWHVPSAAEWTAISGASPQMSNSFYVLAGNYGPPYMSSGPAVWRERTPAASSFGFYWLSKAKVVNELGFVFMSSIGNFEVRTTTGLANLNDYFSLRCIMDEDFKPACGAGTYDLATEVCISGNAVSKCGAEGYVCDARDNIYKTTDVDGKTWMAENLKVGAATTFNWATAMSLKQTCNSTDCKESIDDQHQGICPENWHIPKKSEITSNQFFNSNATWWTATQDGSSFAYSASNIASVSKMTINFSVRCVKND